MVAANLTAVLSTLITANHILDYNSILDGFGHISVPVKNATCFMTGQPPSALVPNRSNLFEFYIDDASPLHPADEKSAYSERFIHQGFLNRYPEVISVVHSHSRIVIPLGISDIALKPTYHMTGFIG